MSKDFRKDQCEYAKYLIYEWNKLIQGAAPYQIQEIIAEANNVIKEIKDTVSYFSYDILPRYKELEASLLKAKKTYLSKNRIFLKKQPKQNGMQPIYMYHRDIDKLEALNPDGSCELISVTFEELEREYISLEEFVTMAYNNLKILERTKVISNSNADKYSYLFYNGYCFSYTIDLENNIKSASLKTCNEDEMIKDLENSNYYKFIPRDGYEGIWLKSRIERLVYIKDYFTSKSLVQKVLGPQR